MGNPWASEWPEASHDTCFPHLGGSIRDARREIAFPSRNTTSTQAGLGDNYRVVDSAGKPNGNDGGTSHIKTNGNRAGRITVKLWVLALSAALAVPFPAHSDVTDPRNPRVSNKNYVDCQRMPDRCAGNDSQRARRDYYRKNTRQGNSPCTFRGEQRTWSEDCQ